MNGLKPVSAILFALATRAAEPPLVPRPEVLQPLTGSLRLHPSMTISASGEALPAAQALAALLKARGLSLHLTEEATARVRLSLDGAAALGEEGYTLRITPTGLDLAAHRPAGLQRGLATLRQLLPAKGLDLPALEIRDRPRFSWRGMHLDVSRHFFGVAEIKRYLDLMALHKFNVFHWHLVDDGGWRLEIRRYPRLTEVGAWREGDGKGWDWKRNRFPGDGKAPRYGGFYTQEQVREIVAYAAARAITVVPEIEMPGHTMPSLAAYPELACGGAEAWVRRQGLQHPNVYCASKPTTFTFVTEVLEEVLTLFPSRFIHIGGDEVDKGLWAACPDCRAYRAAQGLPDEHALQSDFIRRIDAWLTARGRRMVGWDEILEGGLAKGATVMSWRGTEGGIQAARAGHDVVMAPGSHCYFDGAHTHLPELRAWSFDPVPAGFSAAEAAHVLGGQGCVWTETMEDWARVEYMSATRMAALSEALWTPLARKAEVDFCRRFTAHTRHLDALGTTWHLSAPRPLEDVHLGSGLVRFAPVAPADQVLRYTLDGSMPTATSPRLPAPFRVKAPALVTVAGVRPNGQISDPAVVRVVEVAPEPVQVREPGLRRLEAPVAWRVTGDLAAVAGAVSRIVAAVDLAEAPRGETFALQFDGWLRIPSDGLYTFHLTSDDGSVLRLGGQVVVDNDGLHPPALQSARMRLRKGDYPLQIRFIQGGGGAELRLEVEGPEVSRRPVPFDWLWH